MPSKTIILFFLLFFVACASKEKKMQHSNYEKTKLAFDTDSVVSAKPSYYDLAEQLLDNKVFYRDTVSVHTTEALQEQIQSNRLIRLMDATYVFKTTSIYRETDIYGGGRSDKQQALVIEGVKNLKIVGTGSSKLRTTQNDATLIRISDAYNIHLEGIQMEHMCNPVNTCQAGVLRIRHAYNLAISNCQLGGFGTYGLITSDVNNLTFSDSEIRESTVFIFDLEKSRNLTFSNSKFQNNHLRASILGGFTSSTKNVSFLNCAFLDNSPAMTGNPVFNFMGNNTDFEEKIIFENCTFKNNKGFKWYGDKIQLDNCEVDSLDFINFVED